MTDQAPDLPTLLARRLDLVGRQSALTADAQRIMQRLSAARMDVLRLELEIGRSCATPELVRDLHTAEMDASAIEEEQAACEERIVALEAEVDAIDRGIAAN